MSELLDIAILAYRSGKFQDAIDLLSQIVDNDKQNWLAWFYLGTAFLKSGNQESAYRTMRVIAASCPNPHLQGMATSVLAAEQAKSYVLEHSNKQAESDQGDINSSFAAVG